MAHAEVDEGRFRGEGQHALRTAHWWRIVLAVGPAFGWGALHTSVAPSVELGLRLAVASWLALLVARRWPAACWPAAAAAGAIGAFWLQPLSVDVGPSGRLLTLVGPLSTVASGVILGAILPPRPLRWSAAAYTALEPLVAAIVVVVAAAALLPDRLLPPSAASSVAVATVVMLALSTIAASLVPRTFEGAARRLTSRRAQLRRAVVEPVRVAWAAVSGAGRPPANVEASVSSSERPPAQRISVIGWPGAVLAVVAVLAFSRLQGLIVPLVVLGGLWSFAMWLARRGTLGGRSGERVLTVHRRTRDLLGWREAEVDPTRGRLRWIRFPVVAWVAFTVVINATIFRTLEGHSELWDVDRLIANKESWDWHLYVDVIRHGYRPGEGLEAIFPGWPLVIRASLRWVSNPAAPAVLLSLLGGVIATVAVFKWAEIKGLGPRSQRMTVVVFLLQPFGFMLAGMTYPDAAVVACIVVAWCLAERDHLVVAGLGGALATVTRPNALPLIPALMLFGLCRGGVVEMDPPGAARGLAAFGDLVRPFSPTRVQWRRLRPAQLAGGLSVLGIAAFALWLWRDRGEPFAFWSVQVDHYGHPPMTQLSSWLRFDFVSEGGVGKLLGEPGLVIFGEATAAAMTGLTLWTLPFVARRFGLPYAVMNLGLVATFFAGADSLFSPGARLLLPAVPLAALAAEWMETAPRRARWVIVLLAAVMVTTAHGFATGQCCW